MAEVRRDGNGVCVRTLKNFGTIISVTTADWKEIVIRDLPGSGGPSLMDTQNSASLPTRPCGRP